ncbi:MAG: anthranilate synthase component II [Clostridium sp.]|uniref:anthranilate synthase component II n=1 Tax=Clostridium sp. TaxID=1506 RepID=UPI003EE6489C
MIVMIDNYDSFVYNLVRYFEELNEEIKVFRRDKITVEELYKLNPEGIVISPGPKAPKDSKEIIDIIHSFKGKIPILGVCLGHQCIGYAFGGKIIKGEKPVHGKISRITTNKEGIFKNTKDKFNVTRYHSLIVEKESLPKELLITAESEDGVIMGIKHKDYEIYGVQYHPEAVLTEEGHTVLKEFIRICKG